MVETINELQTELFGSDLEEDLELLNKIKDIGLRLEPPISSDDIMVIHYGYRFRD